MAGLANIWLRANLRLSSLLMRRGGVPFARAAQDRLGRLGARVMDRRVDFVPEHFPRFHACRILPEGCRAGSGAILYLHGGGYTAGSIEYAMGFGSVLAAATGCHVLAAAYRLAPEHPFPAAVEDALAAYERLLESGFSANNIALAGESAGGGLCFALVHKLKAMGLPLPRAVVGISPWTDLTLSGASYAANKRRDPTLRRDQLSGYARMYAAGRERDPLVSPLFGDMRGFPPSLIFAGEDELLLDDAVAMAHALERAGSRVELHTEKGMWHVYVLYGVREARDAIRRIASFLNETRGEPCP